MYVYDVRIRMKEHLLCGILNSNKIILNDVYIKIYNERLRMTVVDFTRNCNIKPCRVYLRHTMYIESIHMLIDAITIITVKFHQL